MILSNLKCRKAPSLFGHAINIWRDFMSSVCYFEEFPASRENICPKKTYVILKIIPSAIYIRKSNDDSRFYA